MIQLSLYAHKNKVTLSHVPNTLYTFIYRFGCENILSANYFIPMRRQAGDTSNEERRIIYSLHQSGLSYREIAERLSKSRSTVSSIIQRFKKTGKLEKIKRTGRKEKISVRDQSRLSRKVKGDRTSSKRKILAEFIEESGKGICKRTFDRYASKLGLRRRLATKSQVLGKRYRIARIQ